MSLSEAHGVNSAVSVVSSVDEAQIILDQIVKLQKELKKEAVMHGIMTPEGTTAAKIGPTMHVH